VYRRQVATQLALDRCRERIERLSRSTQDGEPLQREIIFELQHVVGFERWCLPQADPRTLLPGNGIADHDYGPGLPRALELEYSGTDVATKLDAASRLRPVTSLGVETAGDLARSPRWDQVLRQVGIGDIAAAACRDSSGCWGWIEAYRDSSERSFSDDELTLLAEAASAMAGVLRRSVLDLHPGAQGPSEQPGVLVLDGELRVISRTESSTRWIEALPLAGVFAAWGMLPAVIYPAATLARAGHVARAHALLPLGGSRWVTIEAAPIDGELAGDLAVTIREASETETFGVACRAHGLTARESAVLRSLGAGADTRTVAKELGISVWTVQDHLKSVFVKLRVHSRRQAMARLAGAS
jgi:DNA-binding CsgD family transcriptional regulator